MQLQLSSDVVIQDERSQDSETLEIDPETTENQAFQPSKTDFSETSAGGEVALLERILTVLAEGRSDDWIAKNVIMESQRIGYYKAKEKAQSIRRMVAKD